MNDTINEMILCACGCGLKRNAFDAKGKPLRYILGHYTRPTTKNKEEKILCSCGCGELIYRWSQYGNERKFVRGHTHIGRAKSSQQRALISESLKGRPKNDDENRRRSETMRGVPKTEETKLKMSIAQKNRSDEFNKAISIRMKGDNNPAYIHGNSKSHNYCERWTKKFRESVRIKYNHTCFLCGKSQDEQIKTLLEQNKRTFLLAIHHVNYHKDCGCNDNNIQNCDYVPLCLSCHSKTNYKREYWETIIISKLNNTIS